MHDYEMNSIDLALALLIALSVWRGIARGFLAGTARLIAWLGSLLLAFWLYPHLAGFLGGAVESAWAMPLAFLVCVLVIGILFATAMAALLDAIPQPTHTHALNKALGFLPGFASGLVYAGIAAAALLVLPIASPLTRHARESALANRLTMHLSQIERKLAPALGEAVSRSIGQLTIDPESTESVSLPFSVAEAPPRPDLEAAMLELINAARENADLHPLQADDELRPLARAHAADMFARSYFSHLSPEGLTPFDRIRQGNVAFVAAGENLAIAPTLALAHEGLMNSPGHRANILRPAFGRVGIGILDGGVHGLMVTQKFRN